MKRRNEKKHVIDFLFPLAVFFVLAASSIAIVVLASGFYSRQATSLTLELTSEKLNRIMR